MPSKREKEKTSEKCRRALHQQTESESKEEEKKKWEERAAIVRVPQQTGLGHMKTGSWFFCERGSRGRKTRKVEGKKLKPPTNLCRRQWGGMII